MRRLNLSTTLSVAGDATSGAIAYSGLTSPTITEIGDNPDVSVASDGVCTFTALGPDSEVVTVKVQDADGYFIQGPVTIQGNGADSYQYMSLGMNMAGINGYNGTQYFANLMHMMRPWSRRATSGGSGAWSQLHGHLTADVSTDQFVAYISNNGVAFLAGDYIIRNPDGCEYALGANNGTPGTWRTDTEFTGTLNPTGGNGVYLFVKGSLTGNFEIIKADHVDSYDAGCIWTDAALAFYEGLGAGPLRAMDLLSGSVNFETDWSDRVPPDAISFNTHHATGLSVVPYEYLFDLANRLQKDVWINIPARATADYVAELGAVINSTLDPGLKVYTELANETWNWDSPWRDGGVWVACFGHPKYTATANPSADTYTKVGHGLSDGDAIYCFGTPENVASGAYGSMPYQLKNGFGAYAKYINDDTFQLYSDVGLTALCDVVSTQVNLIYVVVSEATEDLNTHNQEISIRNWGILDAICGADRFQHVIASQASSPSVSASRTSLTATREGMAGLAVAPYFGPSWYGVRIDGTTGQFQPKAWANVAKTFYIGVYAQGSTPTEYDIKAGTGTGFVAGQSYTYTSPIGTAWRNTSAPLTGLTDGVTYTICVAVEDVSDPTVTWIMREDVVCSATPANTTITHTTADLKMMCRVASISSTVLGHLPYLYGKKFFAYEGGFHLHESCPEEVATAYKDFQETAEFGEAIVSYLYQRASIPTDVFCYFSDVADSASTTAITPFGIADSHSDTSDERYMAMAALGGRVRVYDALSIDDVVADDVTSEPGAFPYTIATLDPSLSYAIYKGNDKGYFDISGNTLRAVASDLDWVLERVHQLTLIGYNDYGVDLFSVSFATGSAWYDTDTVVAIDYDRDHAYIDGVEYASIAAARTAGAIVQTNGIDRIDITGLLGSAFSLAATGVTYSSTVVGQAYRYIVSLEGPSSDIIFMAQFNDAGTARIGAQVVDGGVDQTTNTLKTASGAGISSAVTYAMRVAANDIAVSFNSTTCQTDSSATVPTLTSLIVGNRDNETRPWLGSVRRILLTNAAVTNAALKTFDIITP